MICRIALIRLHNTSLHYYTINSEYLIQIIVQYLFENESDVVSLLPDSLHILIRFP